MNELVLHSKYLPETHTFRINSHRDGDFGLRIEMPDCQKAGLTLYNSTARQLRDFLNKELGEQAPEPSKPVKAPQLILAWQHPANGRRFIQVSSELVATQNAEELRRIQPDFPIWLAQITKQYVLPNPNYEWKDL